MSEHTLVVRGIVLDPVDRVLLVSHQDSAFWYTPGGHVEPGETLKGGLERELWEEAGITAEMGPLLFVDEFLDERHGERKVEVYFLARTASGEVDDSRQDIGGPVTHRRFFARSELPGLRVFPARLVDEFWALLASGFQGYDPYLDVNEMERNRARS
jgi:8-oxo-dGTP diphosphatase